VFKEFGYPKSKRLLKSTNIHTVMKKGVRLKGSFFDLRSIKNEEGHPRLGIVIGKRNVRLAVDRNSAKRLIREFFRIQQAKIEAVDVVVVANKTAKTSKRDMHQCLESLFSRLKSCFKP
jgi:ribonuclease P protein component